MSREKFQHPGTTVFGPRIKTFRDRLGKSQEEMARLVGVSLSAWRRWEYGQAVPGGRSLEKLHEMGLSSGGLQPPPLEVASPAASGTAGERQYEIAAQGLEILANRARKGNSFAQEKLKHIADLLNKAAGDAARHSERKKHEPPKTAESRKAFDRIMGYINELLREAKSGSQVASEKLSELAEHIGRMAGDAHSGAQAKSAK